MSVELPAPPKDWPHYRDGTPYRIGDVVTEGAVSYARPLRSHEHDERCPHRGASKSKSRCVCSDAWRLVVVPPGGGPALVVRASKTERVEQLDLAPLDEPEEIPPPEIVELLSGGLVRVKLPCGHGRTMTAGLVRLSTLVAAPIMCPRCTV